MHAHRRNRRIQKGVWHSFFGIPFPERVSGFGSCVCECILPLFPVLCFFFLLRCICCAYVPESIQGAPAACGYLGKQEITSKVSVELGLCEMMSRGAISPALAPKDGNWGFDVTEREAILPAGTVDKNAKRVYKELPKWEESVLGTRARYEQIIKDLADNYHTENLLLATHWEGVGVALSAFLKNATVYEVDYCAYVELKRPIFKEDQSFTAGEFEVLTSSGQTGIGFVLPSD